MPGAKVPTTLPQILNHDELVRLFTVTTNRKHRAVLMTGLRRGASCQRARSVEGRRYRLRPDVSCASTRARATRTATSPCRLGCSSTCASTGAVTDLSIGCSPTRPFDRPMTRQTPTRIYQSAKDRARIAKGRRDPYP